MSGDWFAWLLSYGEGFLTFGLFWLFCAAATALLASNRGRNGFKWFALALLVGPLAFPFAVRPVPDAKEPHDEIATKKKK